MKYAIYKTNGEAYFYESKKKYIEYEEIRDLVGGSIEFYRTQHGEQIYCNEEGRLIGLQKNPFYFEDIVGDTVEVGGTDAEGESLGVSDEYVLRTPVSLPKELFVGDKKFTLFYISDTWGATVSVEIKTRGYASATNGKPVFTVKGKRKTVTWAVDLAGLMIFEGWDLPLKNANDIQREKSTHVITMNAMYNLGGMSKEEMSEFILNKQLNPFFILHDHILYVDNDKEELLFPYASPTSQRIADMQSAQLKDGITRMVLK